VSKKKSRSGRFTPPTPNTPVGRAPVVSRSARPQKNGVGSAGDGLPDVGHVSRKAPLQRLEKLRRLRVDVDRHTRSAVRAARAEGASWETVGRALGVSRQTAWERFGKLS